MAFISGLARQRPWLWVSRCFLAFFVWFAASLSLAANNPLSELERYLGDLNKAADKIERELSLRDVTDTQLSRLRLEVPKLSDELFLRALQFQPRVIEIDEGLERLGPKPADGKTESEEIAQERKSLAEQRSAATLTLKDAEILSVRLRQLSAAVIDTQRRKFTEELMTARPVTWELFDKAREQAREEFQAFRDLMAGWLDTLTRFKSGRMAIALVLALSIFVGTRVMVRRNITTIARLKRTEDNPAYLSRLLAALWTALLPSLALALACIAIYQLFALFGLFRFRADQVVKSALIVIAGVAFVSYLIRGVLAPRYPAWRLLNISDAAARRLSWLGVAMAVIYGIDYFINDVGTLLSSPVDLTVIRSFVTTLLIGVLLMATVLTTLRTDTDGSALRYRGWSPTIALGIWLIIVLMIVASVLGYVSLGRFFARQVVITGSIAVTMYIGFLAARSISQRDAFRGTRLGNFLQSRFELGDLAMDQIALLIGLLINIAILLIGVPVILLQWGFNALDLQSWLNTAVNGFSIGGIRISPSGILIGVGVFVLGIVATRIVQRWFDLKVLTRTRFDTGVKDSIRAGIGYTGYFIAALMAVSYAGLNLSNLALIAGALSVGIGFGLQNIVNNFVSGLILLIERPIKTGDIVTVGGQGGTVHKINVRSTEVETFDRETLIIPNADLINSTVGNWMHKDQTRRMILKIGVAYGSDVEKVRQILLDAAAADSRIATTPEPFVYFSDFGASSLDFQLRVILRDIMDTLSVESDMRFRVVAEFDKVGIEIPFPQQDVRIKELPVQPEPEKKPRRTRRKGDEGTKTSDVDGADGHI
ncbi:MAG: mechanosensitive ion channel domain-containing protein [Pseudomonadota bacterium]